MGYICRHSFLFHGVSTSGGGQGGGSPGEPGGGRGREAGEEIKKAIMCCLLLSIVQSKTLIYQSFEISI